MTVLAVLVASSAVAANAMAAGGKKAITPGFYRGTTIGYFDLGPVKVAPGNVVLPLVALTNGVAGQHNITKEAIAPGATNYPPLWGIVMATWKAGAHKRLLTSYAQVTAAKTAGELTL